MARRKPSQAAAPATVIPRVTPFAEWLDRERVTPSVLAGELGITVSYVRALCSGRGSPGAKLRLRIQERTGGAVRFDSWE
jgi:hypothetical protein